MKMWRSVILISAVPLLALSTAAPSALAQSAFGRSSLTITALSPDTTMPYSGTQDSIYIQLSGNAPSGGTVVTSVTIPAGSYLTNVTIATGAVTAVTDVTITATLPSGSLSSQLQLDPPETVSSVSPGGLLSRRALWATGVSYGG